MVNITQAGDYISRGTEAINLAIPVLGDLALKIRSYIPQDILNVGQFIIWGILIYVAYRFVKHIWKALGLGTAFYILLKVFGI